MTRKTRVYAPCVCVKDLFTEVRGTNGQPSSENPCRVTGDFRVNDLAKRIIPPTKNIRSSSLLVENKSERRCARRQLVGVV